MIGCLRTHVRKQPILALYFEFENERGLVNLIPKDSHLGISISRQASRHQQAFSKPCLVNLISKDAHLVLSIYLAGQKLMVKLQ